MEDEAISIRAIDSPALSDQRKQEQAAELRRYVAEVDARRQPDSPEEADEILTEAIRGSRPGYRAHR